MSVTVEYRPVRAPSEHGEALIEPPWSIVDAVLESNCTERAQQSEHDIQGRTLRELAEEARHDLLVAARRYTQCYRDVPAPAAVDSPILLAGHQPQLFHAGVWFKNFALSSLADRFQAQAVNLLIDNDIHRLSSLRVPCGSPEERHIRTVSFDQLSEPIAYEEREILEPETFLSFGQRVHQASDGLLADPILGQLWPLAISAAQRSRNLGHCLAEARHRLEAAWGLQTLELPLSHICHSRGFIHFALHLLAHLPRLHEVYNSSLADYRSANHIRSRSHPVPDLAVDDDWLEAPFWIWTTEAPHRQRLFVRFSNSGLELTDRHGLQISLPFSADAETSSAMEHWLALEKQGVKLRPRALVTTMYARLFLSDLFIHGIGGGKYDQLTDLIIARFLELQAPAYMMISATVLLFPDRTDVFRQRVAEAKRLVRELRFRPELHVQGGEDVQRLIRQKQDWIQKDPPRGQRTERHRNIEALNRSLQEHLPITSDQAWHNYQQRTVELRRESQFASREFSFCLFSAETLRPLLLELSQPSA
jgi:hypothetical protein